MEDLEFAMVPGSTRLRDHAHDTIHLVVVLGGGFAEREGSSWRDMTPGQVRVSAAASHDLTFGPQPTNCLVITAAPDLPAKALQRLARPRFLALDPWLTQLVHDLALRPEQQDESFQLRRNGLCTELFAQLERRIDGRPAPPPSWLTQVRESLHDTRGRMPLAQLAAMAQVHRVHLARAFRDHFGVPVTVYARRIQLDRAQRLLRTTALPLSQVAALAGFADQSHLTRTMRAALGCTPGALRSSALHRFKTTPETTE